MKMSRSNIIIIATSVLVYSVILAAAGVFGQTVQNGLFYFFKNILPIIGIVVGYGLTIFVPIRVFQAMERNKQIKADIENDKKLLGDFSRNWFRFNLMRCKGLTIDRRF